MGSRSNGSPLISNHLFTALLRTVSVPGNFVVTSLGIFSNLANIIIFAKISPKDTMTTCSLALAVADLLYAIFSMPPLIANILIQSGIQVVNNVDLFSLTFIGFLHQKPLFHKISVIILTFMSCERSLCVIRPFLVKQIFTRQRIINILIVIFLGVTALFMPAMVSVKAVWRTPYNKTTPVMMIRVKPERAAFENVIHMSVGLPLIVASQVIIIVSSVLMASGLRRHQKFRQGASSMATKSENEMKKSTFENHHNKSAEQRAKSCNEEASVAVKPIKSGCSDGNAVTENVKSKLQEKSLAKAEIASTKEQRLIKTVLMLAILHIALNFPKFIYYAVYYLVPEFRLRKRYNNTYRLSGSITNLLNALDGMLNTFVYLSVNTKYKLLFKQVFCGQKAL
ncbi:chemosensory receptor c [Plakobranchus ocellatus]|uniref:Chemosensory receptor c n=1 Tax=Plakobranchus ocellatus TaxID=259542 RepID=A0AAV4DNA9_9GAST|nr:chemosensory receptor c [Plakobranchus ocellatus]